MYSVLLHTCQNKTDIYNLMKWASAHNQLAYLKQVLWGLHKFPLEDTPKFKSQSKEQNTMGKKLIYINKITETFTYNLGIRVTQVF